MRFLMLGLGLWLITLACLTARGEDSAQTPAAKESAATAEQIQQWIRDLDSERYQAREDATAALLNGGHEVVAPVAKAATERGLEVAIRAVYVLREAALSEDSNTAEAAELALKRLAETPGVAAPRATRTLFALGELRRRRILAYLAERGVKFQSTQAFGNGTPYPDPNALWFDKDWKGTEEDLSKIKFLTHITTVTLEGAHTTDAWLEKVSQMPSVTALSIKRAKITDAGLNAIKKMPSLQELSVYYSPIGDGAVDVLSDMRGLTKLKLYGGMLTQEGKTQLENAFAQAAMDLDIRRGAFLGVSCGQGQIGFGCVITYVREGSAAAKAGLYAGDIILSYDGKKVSDFETLTAHIAQHAPGDTADMEIQRGPTTVTKKITLGEWE